MACIYMDVNGGGNLTGGSWPLSLDLVVGGVRDDQQTIVRARDEGEEFYLYLRQEESGIVGLAVLVVEEGGDAAVINIVGDIDMTQIARLGRKLNIPHLGEAQELSEGSEDEPDD